MDPLTYLSILGLSALIYVVYRRHTRISLSHIPGPKPESLWLGNLRELYQGEAAEADLKWQEEFGGIARIKAPLGEDRLIISDPKALQYIFHTSGYDFKKQPERRALSRIISGKGIIWAEGSDHKRHRKVMLPGFGAPESKAFLPIFRGYAQQVTSKWKDVIGSTADQSAVLNVHSWLVRATLDAIGEAAFDYGFGALENVENRLGKAYSNLMSDMFGAPSTPSVFIQGIIHHLPISIINLLIDRLPSPRLQRARDTGAIATDVAQNLVESKSQELSGGQGHRDIMSLLVTANAGENQRGKLRDDEMFAQMRTIILAGHETTANTMSWLLFELAKNPEIQKRLREEIWTLEAAVHERGDTDLTVKDFENMPYTVAIMKEVLRFHPVAYNVFRQASRDSSIPLSTPITTTRGQVIDEVLVPKNTKIILSIAAYNRNRDVWGDDAHIFRPERWLHDARDQKAPSVGVYGNLLTFAGGIRSCIGWRFAVIELQAFVIEIVGNFQFSLTPEASRVRREACLVMCPTLEGETEKGAQLPLNVSIASRE